LVFHSSTQNVDLTMKKDNR